MKTFPVESLEPGPPILGLLAVAVAATALVLLAAFLIKKYVNNGRIWPVGAAVMAMGAFVIVTAVVPGGEMQLPKDLARVATEKQVGTALRTGYVTDVGGGLSLVRDNDNLYLVELEKE